MHRTTAASAHSDRDAHAPPREGKEKVVNQDSERPWQKSERKQTEPNGTISPLWAPASYRLALLPVRASPPPMHDSDDRWSPPPEVRYTCAVPMAMATIPFQAFSQMGGNTSAMPHTTRVRSREKKGGRRSHGLHCMHRCARETVNHACSAAGLSAGPVVEIPGKHCPRPRRWPAGVAFICPGRLVARYHATHAAAMQLPAKPGAPVQCGE